MLKKWLYSVFLVLLFFGVGQSFAFEKEARGTELVDSWKKLDELGPDIPSAISFDLRIETKKLDELGSLISTVKQKFALTGIPPSWFDDLSEALLQKLKGIPSNQIDDFAGDLNAIENAIKQKPELVDSWKLLFEANSTLSGNIAAIQKIDFLKTKGLSDLQLKNIGGLNDIKAVDLVENLAKRTNPVVPPQQIDLVAQNAKSLEGVRPAIMDEIREISGNANLKNADGLNGFLDNAAKNPSNSGWKYELDALKDRLNGGSEVEFSKQVPTTTGGTKEVDILDFTKSELVEVKSYSSGSWVTIAKKFGEDVGHQIGKIDNSFKSQFTDHIGHIRIETGGNSTWLNANRTELINNLKQARTQYPEIISDMDNMTKLTIENATGVHTIERSLWQ